MLRTKAWDSPSSGWWQRRFDLGPWDRVASLVMESAVRVSVSTSGPVGFVEKARVFLACVVAVLLLRTVGWMVAEPTDPDMAVSFSASGRAVLASWPALAVLTAVAAVLGTTIAGRRLPEAGVFAAGVGLATLALRGGSMEVLLAYDTTGRRALMMAMARDCLLWTALMAVTWIVNALVWRWLWTDQPAGDGAASSPAPTEPRAKKPAAKPARSRGGWADWPALAITAVIGAVVIWMTIARTPVAVIARGQVIASIAAGLYLGAMAARYFTGIEDARWFVLAVPAVALVGYLLGYINGDMSWAQNSGYKFYALLATTPPHSLARPLPLEYLAVGVPAALAGFWSGQRVEHAVTTP